MTVQDFCTKFLTKIKKPKIAEAGATRFYFQTQETKAEKIMATAAVTGDIGAGKSTASKIFAEKLKCPLIDADKITADLWHNGNVKKIFSSRWGNEIFDTSGEIMKSEISRRIFNDLNEYKFCNSVLHPLVMKELKILSENAKKNSENLVLEIPLLFEALAHEKQEKFFDFVIYVAADFETRARRCFEQRGWRHEELKRRESFLIPREEKISLSDFVIYNDGSLENLTSCCNEHLKNFVC